MATATQDNKNNPQPVVVRLDATALNEAKSILFQAYRHEPTFQYLFDHRRPGYEQRVRATVRELIGLYFDLDQEAIGVMVNETLVAVAFIGEPELRLNLANQLSWRLRMVLTTGFACTRRYLDYHDRIRQLLPQPQAHQLPLMGVHPKYQNRGYGRLLLETVQRLCADNPRGSGLVLDTGNSKYLHFYESEGFRSLGKIQLGNFEDHVLYRDVDGHSAAHPV
ncbi:MULTISPECIES: GNAT family N-acetyltransferase [Marinobacter]|uniref:GNAT family N-acetyltransferase n=1 Tax=Marinobacter xestospongiae TaxID=994319 RepID=A0ABU3VXX2_9GAMM|nr:MULTISPECIES: GNAT family N-acetyltransferase [Marinobacter]MCG8518838.1 GNAT family N-acetyltransferase [Pseudomonadales bacterium]MCK7566006.1 GNAT family N-acetyltransferase [Marinobacter xestospongiae]MDV2079139.1 GNAT family N-acetyltransferase [Marinobacter xestospongiae]UDL06924.1 GNAT family N-acetyltransferase [Marinobacter sp. CA1]